ncbi:AlpA family transcriptional regulator [Alcaligenes sp. NLF5-7]|uniref:helix-turn-helix transcriptional regulator n=1 Tax=Alcaligenes sp. NLF5-7 TaxID=2918755 RepID=UPI0020C30373|nr:AlpA family transcriptional regulator [Alcaligenes sp. NLF5-7]UTM01029.1 AlpA family transcriptional regulator [Alcaligenes sp. NLF5-7]
MPTDTTPHLPKPAFYRMKEVIRITSLSRPTLYRRIAAGRFPAPVKLGGRACGWTSEALDAWIEDPDGYAAPVGEFDTTLPS